MDRTELLALIRKAQELGWTDLSVDLAALERRLTGEADEPDEALAADTDRFVTSFLASPEGLEYQRRTGFDPSAALAKQTGRLRSPFPFFATATAPSDPEIERLFSVVEGGDAAMKAAEEMAVKLPEWRREGKWGVPILTRSGNFADNVVSLDRLLRERRLNPSDYLVRGFSADRLDTVLEHGTDRPHRSSIYAYPFDELPNVSIIGFETNPFMFDHLVLYRISDFERSTEDDLWKFKDPSAKKQALALIIDVKPAVIAVFGEKDAPPPKKPGPAQRRPEGMPGVYDWTAARAAAGRAVHSLRLVSGTGGLVHGGVTLVGTALEEEEMDTSPAKHEKPRAGGARHPYLSPTFRSLGQRAPSPKGIPLGFGAANPAARPFTLLIAR